MITLKGVLVQSLLNHCKFILRLIISVFLILNFLPARASEIIELSDSDDFLLKSQYLDILEDLNGSFDIKDVSSPAFQNRFSNNKKLRPGNDHPESTYWIRFAVKKKQSDVNSYFFEFFDQKADLFEFYIPLANGFKMERGGDIYNFENRTYKHKNFLIDLPVSSQTQWFYIKIKSKSAVTFLACIRSPKALIGYAVNEYIFLGLFFGAVLIIVLYCFFLFLKLKELTYLYYLFYILSMGLYSASLEGVGFQYLWSRFPAFNYYSIPTTLFFTVVFVLLYSRSFLQTKTNAPLVDKLIIGLLIIRSFIFGLGLLFNSSLLYLKAIDLVPFAVIFLAGLSVCKKFKPAYYFLFGFSILFISFLWSAYYLHVAEILGIEDHLDSVFWYYTLNYGIIFEMVVLTYALSEGLRISKNEKHIAQEKMILELQNNQVLLNENQKLKDAANKDLENLVEKRTIELTNAHEKISVMNLLLFVNNKKLEVYLKRMKKERLLQKELNFEDFKVLFPDEMSCLNFISQLKWSEEFQCRKCGHSHYSEWKTPYVRRCRKCKYMESVTAYTVFHGIKFPLLKAFYMLFLLNSRKNLSMDELSELLEISSKTCLSFKRKVEEVGRRKKLNTREITQYILLETEDLEHED